MAHDGTMRVNFDALHGASADIDAAVKRMQDRLAECNKIGIALKNQWDGQAEQAYNERQQIWDKTATHLAEILYGIKNAVQHSADDYLATEKQAAQRFM